MKPSTIFAITVALLLSLGVAVSAKMLGVFETKPPPVVENKEPIKVLVAKQNIYEGIAITGDQVTVRPLRQNELADYQKDPSKYLPATTAAAIHRIPIRHIEADVPLKREYLEDLAFPDGVTLRLGKGMRAVNLSLPKNQVSGGLIMKGDRVDVLMTSKVSDASHPQDAVTLSAFIARDVRVIAKRNSLWTVLASNPDDKPVHYTLELNPYRAALLEVALPKGQITLLPTPSSRDIEPAGGAVPTSFGGAPDGVSHSVLDSAEYRDEDTRVNMLLQGKYAVGDADFERIFQLQPIDRRPPPPPLTVKHISGISPAATSYFGSDGTYWGSVQTGNGKGDRPPAEPEQPGAYRPVVAGPKPMGYTFSLPDSKTGGNGNQGIEDCPTCKKEGK